ncbi:hypothetical protein [Paracoccus aerodenitrificans]|uniref:hypothetical protein n=1 Tax=Paracoccus aerodenitrificans TaxID=3017781 RepID=UPI0022F022FB|nr:hypothetical protein [Paracoccus aerodenitrificans]WBU64151.1 hypothetical protein PAE61_01470 [Paracoccus aerodenitrificans]
MSRFADVTSDTPHGPRPVPEGHISREPVPPSRQLPAPDRKTPKWAIWGGAAVAAAATTALGVYAARAIADAVSDDDHERPSRRASSRRPRPRHAPRFERLSLEERQAMRNRARADFADYEDRAADLRKKAASDKPRKRRPSSRNSGSGFLSSFGDSAGEITRNITGLLAAANAAVDGFHQVSGKADGIVRDFVNAADRLSDFLGSRSTDKHEPTPAATEARGDADRDAADNRTRNL